MRLGSKEPSMLQLHDVECCYGIWQQQSLVSSFNLFVMYVVLFVVVVVVVVVF